jgi:DNA modification methylase
MNMHGGMGSQGLELFQGDCLEVMKSIPDNSVDMVLADPP